MYATYDLNASGCLILYANLQDQQNIHELAHPKTKEFDGRAETEALEHFLSNSELDWISPEEIGALTSAPILGLRDENGEPTAAWGFMDYQVRSFLTDLLEQGKAVFIS